MDDLRARIVEAIWKRENPGRSFTDCEPRWRADAEADADAVMAVVQPELDQLTTVLEKLTARSGRCAQCRCDNCNGLLAQHTEAGCGCPECLDAPGYACSLAEFLPSERINLIAQQLGPLLSSHLNERARLRCVAVAHAAHHALHDYDYPEESLS